jgi:ribonuclease III
MTSLELFLGYEFKNKLLLDKALSHRSFYFENMKNSLGDNEVLEFIGDAVIDLAVSSLLIDKFPNLSEGVLSKMRASLVNEKTLAAIALSLKMQEEMKLGKGELSSGGLQKPRLLASVYESVIGAVYRDSNYDVCLKIISIHFMEWISNLNESEIFVEDFKSRFQEEIQSMSLPTPTYLIKEEFGPSHDKFFVVEVRVQDRVYSVGQGKSKKQAEQDAARVALQVLKNERGNNG